MLTPSLIFEGIVWPHFKIIVRNLPPLLTCVTCPETITIVAFYGIKFHTISLFYFFITFKKKGEGGGAEV